MDDYISKPIAPEGVARLAGRHVDPRGDARRGRRDERHGRILVVDDTDLNRRLLRRLLEAIGHEVDEAADGNEALERLRRADAPRRSTSSCWTSRCRA